MQPEPDTPTGQHETAGLSGSPEQALNSSLSVGRRAPGFEVLVRNALQLFQEGHNGPDFLIGHSTHAKARHAVILMPFLTTQNSSSGRRSLPLS
jgi:hypothetical protein